MPDSTVQKTFPAVILMLGKDVQNKELQVNTFCYINPTSKREPALEKDQFFVHEKDISIYKSFNRHKPKPGYVLIERINDEIKLESGLVIPSCYQSSDQSMFGIVHSVGLGVPGFDDKIGEIVHIKKWDKRLEEIDIDSKYNLSVPFELLDYQTNYAGLTENFVKRK